jgi:hypothetical protein
MSAACLGGERGVRIRAGEVGVSPWGVLIGGGVVARRCRRSKVVQCRTGMVVRLLRRRPERRQWLLAVRLPSSLPPFFPFPPLPLLLLGVTGFGEATGVAAGRMEQVLGVGRGYIEELVAMAVDR